MESLHREHLKEHPNSHKNIQASKKGCKKREREILNIILISAIENIYTCGSNIGKQVEKTEFIEDHGTLRRQWS